IECLDFLGEIAIMTLIQRMGVRRFIQTFERVRTNDMEKPEGRALLEPRPTHKRFFDERRQHVENRTGWNKIVCADRFKSIDSKSTAKNRQPRKQQTFALVEQVETPLDCGSERTMASLFSLVADEQRELFIQAMHDLIRRERSQARCREFQRQ